MTRAKYTTFPDRAVSALGPVSVKLEFRQNNSQGHRDRQAAGGNVSLLAELSGWRGSLRFGTSAKPRILSRPLSREFRSLMPKILKELLRAFNDHAVKYLIAGGYAFGVHAERRAIFIIGTKKDPSTLLWKSMVCACS